ncbi:centromere protein T isoform X2 [Rana temporaria]|nr:centromere protein T isoform X2 [Rana temporaria]
MEDSSQENLTTRSLLKGILATEIVRPAVKHQPKRSIRHASVSRIQQEKIPASPTMSLRSQMKARVRQSFGKLAPENSSVQRNANTKKKKSVNKGFQNIVEELNNITPQSLLKKIIQNEDEVSIVVSQRSKAAAVDHTEQEGTFETKQSSLSIVDLSLPDLQDTGQVNVFRISRKKKRMNSSQFEREVDEKLPKDRDNSSKLKDNVEERSSLVNSSVKTRSFQDHLDVSLDPQSTNKKALLRKPNKAFLVSLGDFEQGVEDKYNLIKGSQECFVESIMEDKSSVSTRGVAELNTELYVPPLLAEINTIYSEKRLSMSNSLVSSEKKKYGTGNMSNSANISINVPPKAVFPDIQKTEVMEEKYSATTSNKWKSVLMVKDVEHLDTNQSMQKSLPGVKYANKFESDKNIHKSVSAVKNISHFGTKQERATEKSVSMEEDFKHTEETRSTENSVLTVEDARSFQLHQSLSKSRLQDKDGRPITPYWKMQKSELVEAKERGSFDSNVNKGVEMMETANSAKYETLHTVLTETKGKHELNSLSWKIQNYTFNKEDGNQYTESLNVSSRQEDNSESSQGHNSENFLQTESTMEGDVISPEYPAKVNKQSMISALIETPAYIRKARLTIPPNKLVGKKIHRKTALKTKKDGSAFKSSLVKRILSLHAKMQLSKNASTDAEKSLEMFLDQMTSDLAAYTVHANRKTITLADLELLMKRQHLVTDTTSFNVLIERHLPLECRKLLISCAMSGNQVYPKM